MKLLLLKIKRLVALIIFNAVFLYILVIRVSLGLPFVLSEIKYFSTQHMAANILIGLSYAICVVIIAFINLLLIKRLVAHT